MELKLSIKSPDVNLVSTRYFGRIPSVWTPETTALLRELVAKGLTFGQCAPEIGVSRCAVIGKAWRLGLQSKTKPSSSIVRERKRVAQKMTRGRKRTKTSNLAPDTSLPSTEADNPVTITELKYHHCRWPCSGDGVDTIYCGGKRGNTWFPYCDRHAFIACRVSEGSTS